MVSFGGGFFNELLGLLKSFKQTQTEVADAIKSGTMVPAGLSSTGLSQAPVPSQPAESETGSPATIPSTDDSVIGGDGEGSGTVGGDGQGSGNVAG